MRNGRLDIINVLLDCGADISVASASTTSLILSVIHDHEDICNFLLKRGAYVNGSSQSSPSTPLLVALSWGRTTYVPILLSHGADPNARNTHGDTPLHYAAS